MLFLTFWLLNLNDILNLQIAIFFYMFPYFPAQRVNELWCRY